MWQTLLVDGQALLRDLLAKRLGLDSRFAVIDQVDDPQLAKTICERCPPDLIVIDIQLPYPGGMELVQHLLANLPRTRVLVLSGVNDPLLLNQLHEAGVHGFVEKSEPLEILEEAMVEVASGKRYFTAALCRVQEKLQRDPTAFSKILNPREQEVLRLVAAGLTSKTIARELKLSPRSVETYRYRIMRKLGVENLAGLIRFALQLQNRTQEAEPAPGTC